MKKLSLSRVWLGLAILGAVGGPSFALRADEPSAPAPASAPALAPAQRPTLKLQVDASDIDRATFERVSYAAVVKKAAPSVVNISASKKVRSQTSDFFNDPAIRRFFGAPDNQEPDRMEKQQDLGSGVVLTPDGYILTNNHMVEGADDIEVSLSDGSTRQYKARVVGRDPHVDVAVLKIDATGLPAATLGDSDHVQVGDVVLAIGNPFNLDRTVTHGIVSAVGRGTRLHIEDYENFIQTDAPINPGNSGGALLDTDGRVIGINTAILSSSGGSNGVGFAIPINLARSEAEQLVHTGRIVRGFLGVSLEPELTQDMAAEYGVSNGVQIDDVTADSPADRAGLKSGDIITKIDGKTVDDDRRLQFIVGEMAPGAQITIEYVRMFGDGHKTATVTTTLVEMPGQAVAGGDTGDQGDNVGVLNHVGVTDITADARDELDLPKDLKGAIITDVDADSASAAAGLQQGDVILALDGKPVHDADEAVLLSKEIKGPKVVVRIWRDGHSHFVVVDESTADSTKGDHGD